MHHRDQKHSSKLYIESKKSRLDIIFFLILKNFISLKLLTIPWFIFSSRSKKKTRHAKTVWQTASRDFMQLRCQTGAYPEFLEGVAENDRNSSNLINLTDIKIYLGC